MQDSSITSIGLGKLTLIRWPGTVSAPKNSPSVEDVLENLDAYYVHANETAATRCIDGRHDPKLNEADLGAQMPGGAPGAALAYRLGVSDDDLTKATFLDDSEQMIDTFLRLGLTPGGHKDDKADAERIGCGAIDNMAQVISNMTSSQLVEDHKRMVKLLLADEFNRNDYLRVLGAALVLSSRSKEYFRDNNAVIDQLEKKSPGGVATLEGVHQESFVFVNYVPNTTFASNRFFDMYGVQAFGYDVWRSKLLSEQLYGLQSESARRIFVHARVMLAVATMMTLTDGSQYLIARTAE